MSNERAERWLRSLGYEPEPEPEWITEGQKSDFFCAGDRPLWVEVKTFDPTAEQREMARALEDLKQRCAKEETLSGRLYVMLGASYEQQAGRWLLAQLRQGLRAEGCINTYVVPLDAEDYSETVLYGYDSVEGRVLHTCVKSESGKYPWHPSLEPQTWGDHVIICRNGLQDEGPQLYDLFESDASRLSVSWYPSGQRLDVGSAAMPFTGNTTGDRIQAAVKAANKQIRNGQNYRAVPGLCVIYHDNLDHADDTGVAAALFGNMQIPIGGTLSEHVMGRGGAWNSKGKNNGVGAVRYFRTDESFVTVINPWADQPVDRAIFLDRPLTLIDRKLIQL